jgi:4-amino-4-deoxy-L-arabinose transferase-like glycosyltransferase
VPRLRRPARPPAALLLAAAAFLLFTLGLGRGSLWDQDEPRYTDIARQITERGDPITLYHNGEPWFVHPPLYMWLVAATGWLLGFSEFTARIWTSLFGTGGVLVTFLLGRRLYGAHAGLVAGLIVMTTLEYFVLSRLAIFDVVLVTFMLAALYMVLAAEEADAAGRRRALRWAFVWAGLATLTKGPIGLLLPAMAVGAWWLWRGVLVARLRALPAEGLLLYAVIGLSWYALEAARHGLPFLQRMVGYYMVGRFFGVVENQPGPWYYYLPVLALGGFPWSALFPSLAVYHGRRFRRDPRSLLLLIWIGVTVLFYSAAGTKLPNYVLPVFPVAAIAAGPVWVRAIWERDTEAAGLVRWGAGLLLLGGLALGTAVMIFGQMKYPAEFAAVAPHLRRLGVMLAVGVVVAALFLAARAYRQGFAVLTATMVATLLTVALATVPHLERLRATKPMALALRAVVRPEDKVVGIGLSDRASLVYYGRHPIIWLVGVESLARRNLCGPRRGFLIITRAEYERWARGAFAGELITLRELGDMVLLETAAPLPCPPAPSS